MAPRLTSQQALRILAWWRRASNSSMILCRRVAIGGGVINTLLLMWSGHAINCCEQAFSDITITQTINSRIFSTIEITSDYNNAITAIRNVFMKGRQGQKSNLIRLRDESVIHMINRAIITKFIIQNITIKNRRRRQNIKFRFYLLKMSLLTLVKARENKRECETTFSSKSFFHSNYKFLARKLNRG